MVNEFTKQDDLNLTVYIAENNPGKKNRLGTKLYKRLVENKYKLWSWSARHPWSSWLGRYKANQAAFDRRVQRWINTGLGDRTPSPPPVDTPIKRRIGFTDRDDDRLIRFLAQVSPWKQAGVKYGRSGNFIYRDVLVANPEKYPWASLHSWQSWRDRYVKRHEAFDERILRWQKRHGIDPEALAKNHQTLETPGKVTDLNGNIEEENSQQQGNKRPRLDDTPADGENAAGPPRKKRKTKTKTSSAADNVIYISSDSDSDEPVNLKQPGEHILKITPHGVKSRSENSKEDVRDREDRGQGKLSRVQAVRSSHGPGPRPSGVRQNQGRDNDATREALPLTDNPQSPTGSNLSTHAHSPHQVRAQPVNSCSPPADPSASDHFGFAGMQDKGPDNREGELCYPVTSSSPQSTTAKTLQRHKETSQPPSDHPTHSQTPSQVQVDNHAPMPANPPPTALHSLSPLPSPLHRSPLSPPPLRTHSPASPTRNPFHSSAPALTQTPQRRFLPPVPPAGLTPTEIKAGGSYHPTSPSTHVQSPSRKSVQPLNTGAGEDEHSPVRAQEDGPTDLTLTPVPIPFASPVKGEGDANLNHIAIANPRTPVHVLATSNTPSPRKPTQTYLSPAPLPLSISVSSRSPLSPSTPAPAPLPPTPLSAPFTPTPISAPTRIPEDTAPVLSTHVRIKRKNHAHAPLAMPVGEDGDMTPVHVFSALPSASSPRKPTNTRPIPALAPISTSKDVLHSATVKGKGRTHAPPSPANAYNNVNFDENKGSDAPGSVFTPTLRKPRPTPAPAPPPSLPKNPRFIPSSPSSSSISDGPFATSPPSPRRTEVIRGLPKARPGKTFREGDRVRNRSVFVNGIGGGSRVERSADVGASGIGNGSGHGPGVNDRNKVQNANVLKVRNEGISGEVGHRRAGERAMLGVMREVATLAASDNGASSTSNISVLPISQDVKQTAVCSDPLRRYSRRREDGFIKPVPDPPNNTPHSVIAAEDANAASSRGAGSDITFREVKPPSASSVLPQRYSHQRDDLAVGSASDTCNSMPQRVDDDVAEVQDVEENGSEIQKHRTGRPDREQKATTDHHKALPLLAQGNDVSNEDSDASVGVGNAQIDSSVPLPTTGGRGSVRRYSHRHKSTRSVSVPSNNVPYPILASTRAGVVSNRRFNGDRMPSTKIPDTDVFASQTPLASGSNHDPYVLKTAHLPIPSSASTISRVRPGSPISRHQTQREISQRRTHAGVRSRSSLPTIDLVAKLSERPLTRSPALMWSRGLLDTTPKSASGPSPDRLLLTVQEHRAARRGAPRASVIPVPIDSESQRTVPVSLNDLSPSTCNLIFKTGLDAIFKRMEKNHGFTADVVRRAWIQQNLDLNATDKMLLRMRIAAENALHSDGYEEEPEEPRLSVNKGKEEIQSKIDVTPVAHRLVPETGVLNDDYLPPARSRAEHFRRASERGHIGEAQQHEIKLASTATEGISTTKNHPSELVDPPTMWGPQDDVVLRTGDEAKLKTLADKFSEDTVRRRFLIIMRQSHLNE